MEDDFKNFNSWIWKPGIFLEKEIIDFFRINKNKKNDSEKYEKVVFISLWGGALGIIFLILSFILSRFKSFNKTSFFIILFSFLILVFKD